MKTAWNKGLHLTEEHKQKLREAKLRKPTNYWSGKKRSEDTISKISKTKTGCIGHNKGKKFSKEWCDNISKGRKGKMTGSNHPNWTGDNKYSDNYRERRRFRREMQKKVFERDNYTCQKCGQYGGDLQVEHIKEWSKYPELRFEMDNCITLCMDCHYERHFNKKRPDGVVWGHNMCRRIES